MPRLLSGTPVQPGDIILVYPSSAWDVLGQAIAWVTRNPYSHAAIVVSETECVEALYRVTKVPVSKYFDRADVYAVQAPTDVRWAASRVALARVGNRYGFRELAYDLLMDLEHRPLYSRIRLRHYTCSGLVYVCYSEVGITLTHAPYPSPADLSYSPLLVGTRPWEVRHPLRLVAP